MSKIMRRVVFSSFRRELFISLEEISFNDLEGEVEAISVRNDVISPLMTVRKRRTIVGVIS